MLETEEVDIDYFTPASGTSLAKIFSNSLKTDDEPDNNSLKYVPPLPSKAPATDEQPKPTQCVYATALYAYEWLKNSYVSKERLGFAIMKIVKSGIHNMVLYDSNKITLSYLTITSNTEINLKKNVSLSYYDNQRKYWTVYTNPQELNKIVAILKELNVLIKLSKDGDVDDNKHNDTINTDVPLMPTLTDQLNKDDNESDTDSKINRRTKDSILKRMATMGQSVLPSSHMTTAHTSDSSDTNDISSQHKARHKPFKSSNKKIVEKKNDYDSNEDIQTNKALNISKPISLDITTKPYKNDQQIVPIRTFDIIKSPINITESTDMNLFISEQRVNNSELRINMNRITDKLDILLDKVKDSGNSHHCNISHTSSHFQNEIVQKLLNEYEKKIKSYEEFIKSKGFDIDNLNQATDVTNKIELKAQESENTINPFEELCNEKDKEIDNLKEQLQLLSGKLEVQEIQRDIQSELAKEISDLKDSLTMKNDEIFHLNKQLERVTTLSNDGKNTDITNKLKEIMNDTFQTISANFDNETNYMGAAVKGTVAAVIKKTTINILKET